MLELSLKEQKQINGGVSYVVKLYTSDGTLQESIYAETYKDAIYLRTVWVRTHGGYGVLVRGYKD
ncbi:hypothetical protein [Clostridium sp. C2-6-12]|uniref:hypothetical protein n=1 Tax=Clostridium sp. C2-6-12 TaxID=2698832 RepID=UPI00136BE442|nr:hypothetical protein [Clostridium sp. C2-6-12]